MDAFEMQARMVRILGVKIEMQRGGKLV
jgi:hypothetical protein